MSQLFSWVILLMVYFTKELKRKDQNSSSSVNFGNRSIFQLLSETTSNLMTSSLCLSSEPLNSIKLIYCPQHGGRRKSLSPLFFPSRCSLLHASNISHLKLLLHTSTHIHPPPRQSIKVTSRGLRQTGSVEHCRRKKNERQTNHGEASPPTL